MKKIAIIGSRDLACKITKWLSKQENIEIIGGICPPFKGWWKDELDKTFDKLKIKKFETLQSLIDSSKPDIIFSINFWEKIDKKIIDQIPEGIINLHHSYLLKYKGRYSTSWAIINARKHNCWVHGTTLHYINENLDEGKIIESYRCKIFQNDTAEILFGRVEKLAFKMFKNTFKSITLKTISYKNPDENTFFYDKDSNKNLEISIYNTQEEIYDFVRAWSFKDRPKPYLILHGKKVYLSLE